MLQHFVEPLLNVTVSEGRNKSLYRTVQMHSQTILW